MYTDYEMRRAFAVVQPDDWRDPISALIEFPGEKNLACLTEAIIHFTGSFPHVVVLDDGILKVEAIGYSAVQAMVELDYLH